MPTTMPSLPEVTQSANHPVSRRRTRDDRRRAGLLVVHAVVRRRDQRAGCKLLSGSAWIR
jgi:hypothetical protein